MNDRYQMAVDYQSYHLICKLQRYWEDVVSEIQKMKKKVTVQMKDQVLNGQDSTSVIKFLTESKRAYDSSRIHGVRQFGSLEYS